MSYNINEAQAKLLATDFQAEKSEAQAQYTVINDVLDKYCDDFLAELEIQYNSLGVAASGDLISTASIDEIENGRVINLLKYYRYVNKGVKGWFDDRNAPNSPYQYKTKGMSEKGRESITRYIQSAKGKSRITESYKPYGISERKFKKISTKTPLEKAVDKAIYMIKKYGIKTNPFFDNAYEKVFGDLNVVVSEVTAETVKIMVRVNLEEINNRPV
jgi:hypothetical protein